MNSKVNKTSLYLKSSVLLEPSLKRHRGKSSKLIPRQKLTEKIKTRNKSMIPEVSIIESEKSRINKKTSQNLIKLVRKLKKDLRSPETSSPFKINEQNDDLPIEGLESQILFMQKETLSKQEIVASNLQERNLIPLNNVFESCSDSEDEALLEERTLFFLPSNMIYGWFKIALDIQILLSLIILPILAVMYIDYRIPSILIFLSIVAIDLLFPVDVIITIFRAEELGRELVIKKGLLMLKYATSYMLTDILASFPISLVFFSTANLKSFNMLLIFIVVLICRFAKLFGKHCSLNKLDIFSKPISNQFLKFFINFIILMHAFTCFFLLINSSNFLESLKCFPKEDNFFDDYFTALYFSFSSILTVGYGDLKPCANEDRLLTVFFIFFGSMFYSFLISLLSTVFNLKQNYLKQQNLKISVLNEIRDDFGVNEELYNEIRHHLSKNMIAKSTDFINLIEDLPINFRKQLLDKMYFNVLKNMLIFKGENQEVILFLLPKLILISFDKKEIIVELGKTIQEVFIVHKGKTSIYGTVSKKPFEIGKVPRNHSYGEFNLAASLPADFEIRSHSKVECFSIGSSIFFELFVKFRKYAERLVSYSICFNKILFSRNKLANYLSEKEQTKESIKEALKLLNEILYSFYDNSLEITEIISKFDSMEREIIRDIVSLYEKENFISQIRDKNDILTKHLKMNSCLSNENADFTTIVNKYNKRNSKEELNKGTIRKKKVVFNEVKRSLINTINFEFGSKLHNMKNKVKSKSSNFNLITKVIREPQRKVTKESPLEKEKQVWKEGSILRQRGKLFKLVEINEKEYRSKHKEVDMKLNRIFERLKSLYLIK